MLQLNYYFHLLLNSKYRVFINLSIISIIYIFLYNDKLVLCMNGNSNTIEVPEMAETKKEIKPSHQVQALTNEIKNFAGNIASLLEEKDQIIAEQQKELVNQKNLINRQFWVIQENTDIITYQSDELDKQSLALNQLELELIHLRNLPPKKACCCIS